MPTIPPNPSSLGRGTGRELGSGNDGAAEMERLLSLDRRAFIRSVLGGSLGLAAGFSWPLGLLAGGRDTGVPPTPAGGFPQPESNRRMAALLAKITREADPLKNPFRNGAQVAILRDMMAKAAAPEERLRLRIRLAWQLLDSGAADVALSNLDAIEATMEEMKVPLEQRAEPEWLTFKAMCFLRLGENENCVARHNVDSCLFPIQSGGVHSLQRGSRGAVEVLTELLTKYPGDLRARWLINLAYMTLGEYPEKVPSQWLIEPGLFASDYDIKHFPDVAGSVGLDVQGLAGGIVLEDLDNDGFLDLMVSSWGVGDQLRPRNRRGDVRRLQHGDVVDQRDRVEAGHREAVVLATRQAFVNHGREVPRGAEALDSAEGHYLACRYHRRHERVVHGQQVGQVLARGLRKKLRVQIGKGYILSRYRHTGVRSFELLGVRGQCGDLARGVEVVLLSEVY